MKSQNSEAAMTNWVSLGLHRTFIKNRATRVALVAAIVKATTIFNTPRSISATRYVTTVNTTRLMNMMAYVFIVTIFSDMASSINARRCYGPASTAAETGISR